MILSIVALVEVLAIAIVSVSAWVENQSYQIKAKEEHQRADIKSIR